MLVLRVGTGGEFRVSGCIRSAIRHALRQSATYSKRHNWRDSVAPRENAAPALLAEISKTASDVKERVVEMCIFHRRKRKRRYAASWWITPKIRAWRNQGCLYVERLDVNKSEPIFGGSFFLEFLNLFLDWFWNFFIFFNFKKKHFKRFTRVAHFQTCVA